MAASDDTIVEHLRDAVPELIAVYRFGSTATGQAIAESDVDVAVLAGAQVDPESRFRIQEDLARALGRDVDLLDLLSVSTVMRMQVVSTGALLIDLDQAARIRFENYVYSAYTRLNEERRSILERVRAEKKIHA